MSPIDIDMEGQYGKIRYLSLSVFQNVIIFLINIFLSFPEYFKRIYLHLLHSNEDHRSTLIYPSLQTVDIPSSSINDIHHNPLSKPHDINDQSCKPHETKVNLVSFLPFPSPSKIQERYKPLRLPSILHDFPPKHYKYLPMFDGESITTEKHIQALEHVAYFFEIEHDDVFMRIFS